MSRHSKQIVFVGLTALLIAVPRCFTPSSVQAFQTVGKQITYLQVTQANPQPTESSKPQPVTPSTLQPQQVIEWVKKHPPAGISAIVILLYFGVLGLRPTWLLGLPLDKIPKIGSIPEIPIPPAIGSFLKYRPRVLDAWVDQRFVQAQEEFHQRKTVGERSVHIPIPVELNGSKPAIADFGIDNLRTVFSKRVIRLLIVGEGGVGKTSLACQIAKWAMADNETERLCKHRMLPVLIEEELEAVEGKSPLLEAITRQIKSLRDDEKPVSEELLKQLLEKRRILVIVDHLSEMSEATRKAARLRDASSPVNALIVTSRLEGVLDKEVTHTTLKPQRVEGKQLFNFVYDYITQQEKRDLFVEVEPDLFLEAPSRLSRIVPDHGDVTVLFAKLYADQMIAVAEGFVTEDLPDNIPDLMLNYINEVNREKDGKIDDDIVQRDLKVIAWECLKQTFKPETAEREQVINCLTALEGEGEALKDSAKKRMEYLEKRLSLIRTVSSAKTKLRFELDPLAEYLAGLHLVKLYGEDEQAWRAFLEEARNKPKEIRGFLLALRDCCIVKSKEAKIPDFLVDEIAEVSDLDLEILRQEQQNRYVRHLISDLSLPYTDNRIYAAQALGAIGSPARRSISALVKALKDENKVVRATAASALGQIGLAAKEVVYVLIKLLEDEDELVCDSAAEALGKYGSAAERAIPALAERLKRESQDQRSKAAPALAQIGQASVSTLTKLLKDERRHVHRRAAQSLGYIGAAAESAVPDLVILLKQKEQISAREAALALGRIGQAAIPSLVEALKCEDWYTRENVIYSLAEIDSYADIIVPYLIKFLGDTRLHFSTISVLGKLGPAAEPAVPALITVLTSENQYNRRQVVNALGEIGQKAKQAVPALIELLNDVDTDIRRDTVTTLGKIGTEAKQAIPALIELFADEEFLTNGHMIASALGDIGYDAVPALIEALKSEQYNTRFGAASALEKIGAEAEAATPHLLQTLKDNKETVRWSSALALGSISSNLEVVVPALIDALEDSTDSVRGFTARALGELGSKAKSAIPALIKVLTTTTRVHGLNPHLTRSDVIKSLTKIDPQSEEVISALLQALKDEFYTVRCDAAFELVKTGNRTDVNSALKVACKDEDFNVRCAAKQALEQINSSKRLCN